MERTNKNILEILHVASTLQEFCKDWLPRVAASINGSVNASTDKTQHYIVYGSDKRLPYDIIAQPRKPVYTCDKVPFNTLQVIQASVHERLQASRAKMMSTQHSRATPVSISIGDSVVEKTPGCQSKLTPKFSGPFLVAEKLHSNKFRIHYITLFISESVHVNRLKKVDVPVPSPDLLQLSLSSPLTSS